MQAESTGDSKQIVLVGPAGHPNASAALPETRLSRESIASSEGGRPMVGAFVGEDFRRSLERGLGRGCELVEIEPAADAMISIPSESLLVIIEFSARTGLETQQQIAPLLDRLPSAAEPRQYLLIIDGKHLPWLLQRDLSSIDLLTQPARTDELLFRAQRTLDNVTMLRWAEHLTAALESLRLASVTRGRPTNNAVSNRLGYREALRVAQERAAFDYLEALMRETNGNVARSASRAGLTRESLHRLLRQHGIRPGAFKAPP